MEIAPILEYLIYDGFEKYLDAAMVYERLMYITGTSVMHLHALTFLCSCMIVQLRPNNSKLLLP